MILSFFEAVNNMNTAVNNIVWGVPMLALMIGAGVYFTLRSRFFQVFRARHIANSTIFAIFKKKSVTTVKNKKAISQFQAMATALAGALGTGNIAGVATAITIGGPGAIFWMWISAFFGMMTGYSENVLGMYYRKKNAAGEWAGGPMYYLSHGLGEKRGLRVLAKPFAVLFAVFCVLASFGIGNMTQANSIATSLEASFSIHPLATGIALAALVGVVIIGGVKRIAAVTEKIVPFMAVVYIALTLFICFANIKEIPAAFTSIFRGAFGISAVAGGVSGAMLKEALTIGLKRGVFSNEAGLGSSVLVHTSADVQEPAIQGMWSIFEIFLDTILMCSLTALAILTTGVAGTLNNAGERLDGAPLVAEAFSKTFGGASGSIVAVSVLFFAFATLLGWSFFGTKALEYLVPKKGAINAYKALFVVFIVVGSSMDLSLVWHIADTLNGLMAFPNLIGILALSGTVFKITRNYSDRNIKRKKKNVKPMLSAFPNLNTEQNT
ncbi:MAG: sodium:alanine symporter family protein [Oscillospiraceae bacterium]|jgi:AGCS family alanine or glycine:cation symporter|nr:sodium:alanine symporter family protein [Oscillospiraceae bacterium]